MNRLFALYKNKYFKLLIFIIFLVFLYKNHFGLEHLRSLDKQPKYVKQKSKLVKKVKTVLSDIRDGHGSYTKEISYQYESDEKEEEKESLQSKINNKIAQELSRAENKKEEKESLRIAEWDMIKKIDDFTKSYEVTENKKIVNKKNSIKCGNIVKYKLATFINGKPVTLDTLDSIILIGINYNKVLESKFKGRQKGDIFEIDMNTLLGDNKDIFQKAIKESQVQNNYSNNNYQLQNIDLKYRIKITEITEGDINIINKYCKNEKYKTIK